MVAVWSGVGNINFFHENGVMWPCGYRLISSSFAMVWHGMHYTDPNTPYFPYSTSFGTSRMLN